MPDVRQTDQNLVNAVSISGEALESDDEGETDPPIPALRGTIVNQLIHAISISCKRKMKAKKFEY